MWIQVRVDVYKQKRFAQTFVNIFTWNILLNTENSNRLIKCFDVRCSNFLNFRNFIGYRSFNFSCLLISSSKKYCLMCKFFNVYNFSPANVESRKVTIVWVLLKYCFSSTKVFHSRFPHIRIIYFFLPL